MGCYMSDSPARVTGAKAARRALPARVWVEQDHTIRPWKLVGPSGVLARFTSWGALERWTLRFGYIPDGEGYVREDSAA